MHTAAPHPPSPQLPLDSPRLCAHRYAFRALYLFLNGTTGDDESQISFFKGVLPGAGEVEVDQHSLIPLDSSAPNPFDDDGLVQATAALANSSNSDNDRDTKKSQSVHPSVAVSTSPDNNCIQAASDRRLPTPTSSRTQNSSVEDGDSDGVYSSEEGISSCNEPNASLDFDGNSIGQDDADPCVSRGKQHRTRNTSRASKNNLAEQFEREPKGRDDNRSYSKDRNGAEGRGTVGDQGQQRDMNTRRVPRMASGIRRSETKRKTRKDLQEGGGADDEEGGQEGTENVHHLQVQKPDLVSLHLYPWTGLTANRSNVVSSVAVNKNCLFAYSGFLGSIFLFWYNNSRT